jgi:hypothetical protein
MVANKEDSGLATLSTIFIHVDIDSALAAVDVGPGDTLAAAFWEIQNYPRGGGQLALGIPHFHWSAKRIPSHGRYVPVLQLHTGSYDRLHVISLL